MVQSLPPLVMEFHVSRRARQRYAFDEPLLSLRGKVISADPYAARRFAQKINAKRDLQTHPEQAARASEIHAMGLIDEILHLVIAAYRQQRNPRALEMALNHLDQQLGQHSVDKMLQRFVEEFPPLAVYRGEMSASDYLAGASADVDGTLLPNRQTALEELLLLWLANENPAFQPYLELFDDAELERQTVYRQVFPLLHEFFATQPPFGPDNQNLIDMLRTPALVHPTSLAAQLEFIRTRWGALFPFILARLLSALDLIREETKPIFGVGGPGPALVYDFRGAEYETEFERFSPDQDWMPTLVLLAKNTYVWLDQLSRKYHRPIHRLDDIPEEELAQLARWGISGLWLIGLWERSPASQKIKQLRGNPNAVASAYSLFSYDIAADLGGEEAYQALRQRAWRYGIRLASDMVPNHMGIDSRWVMEHPDWFIQLPYSPFPTYTFNGPNLSWNARVGIFLEDHYYDNSDAAVVFKRVDFATGEERYIYHGNDGTSMPWNDTAQLNYLLPEVREAVIQTILHVARKFPIIRFDAAMTLTKRHYQRLWFPEPGSGGDIPSRAGHGMTKEEFDRAFPEEFWRLVVDRVAQEVPDTLLLAEAFWLMEGYFVRTLGMHRVYNSAFMNMLRDEKNQEYRLVMKNTLEFDPEILKRFVNFMNNPDERTAADQFGKGDKYFGVCTMMVTLPGLPMFGHGQIEGFFEKYGMEFRFPQWHEQPDEDLIRAHERLIFPLLRRRNLFAEVRHFLLYDFYTPEGHVNEDVFAYSNRLGDQAALVVYHNRYAETRGYIHKSAAYAVKGGQGEEKTLVQRTLAEGLGLRCEAGWFTIFRDHVNGLEYIRQNLDLCHRGLYLELRAYEYHVFLDFRQVQDDPQGTFARLAWELQGRGVPSVEEARRAMILQPVLSPFEQLVNPGMFTWLIENRSRADGLVPPTQEQALAEVHEKGSALLQALASMLRATEPPAQSPLRERPSPVTTTATHPTKEDQTSPFLTEPPSAVKKIEALAQYMTQSVQSALRLTALQGSAPQDPETQAALTYLLEGPQATSALATGAPATWGVLLSALIVAPLGQLLGEEGAPARSRAWLDEYLFTKPIAATLSALGHPEVEHALALIRYLVGQPDEGLPAFHSTEAVHSLLSAWLSDDAVRRFLRVHTFQGVEYFHKEAFEELTWWTVTWRIIRHATQGLNEAELSQVLAEAYRLVQALLEAEANSSYRTEGLLRG